MVSLRIIDGPDKGKVFEIPNGGLIIGRGPGTIGLRDSSVSRRHARIYRKEDKYYIQDLNSINGTFINGIRIDRPVELKHGDHVRVGKAILSFNEEEYFEVELDETEFSQLIDFDVDGSLVDSSIMSVMPADQQVLIAPKDPQLANKHLGVLYELVRVSSSMFRADVLLNEVMNLIFKHVPADRGFILVLNEKTGKFEPVAVKYRDENQTKLIATSTTIIKHVLRNRIGVLCKNAMTDQRFSMGDSVHGFNIKSVICVPIIARDKIIGIIHIDCAAENFNYNESQLHLLTAIGYQTGLAIQNIRLFQETLSTARLAAIGQVVASLSHYIKNILQGLQGGADTVELGIRADNVKIMETGWRIVKRNLDKIQNLVLNMLALGKDRQPKLELQQVNTIVKDIIELIGKVADERGIMIISDLAEDLPPIYVDSEGIHGAVLNIVNNALDAVPENTGVITIRTFVNGQGDELVISVGDNGPGIKEDQIDKIFDLFHSTKGHKGTGLGLAVTKKIVEEHKGRVEVISHEGEGAIFNIRLPLSQLEDGGNEASGDTNPQGQDISAT